MEARDSIPVCGDARVYSSLSIDTLRSCDALWMAEVNCGMSGSTANPKVVSTLRLNRAKASEESIAPGSSMSDRLVPGHAESTVP